MNDAWSDRLKQEYGEWLEKYNHNVEALSDEEMKNLLEEELLFTSDMSVEEYTLWQKWHEIQRKYPTKEVSTLFGKEKVLIEGTHIIDKAKSMMWKPKSINLLAMSSSVIPVSLLIFLISIIHS